MDVGQADALQPLISPGHQAKGQCSMRMGDNMSGSARATLRRRSLRHMALAAVVACAAFAPAVAHAQCSIPAGELESRNYKPADTLPCPTNGPMSSNVCSVECDDQSFNAQSSGSDFYVCQGPQTLKAPDLTCYSRMFGWLLTLRAA